MENLKSHTYLFVYKRLYSTAIEVFFKSKDFPSEERYSLKKQSRRLSRPVSANIAEAEHFKIQIYVICCSLILDHIFTILIKMSYKGIKWTF